MKYHEDMGQYMERYWGAYPFAGAYEALPETIVARWHHIVAPTAAHDVLCPNCSQFRNCWPDLSDEYLERALDAATTPLGSPDDLENMLILESMDERVREVYTVVMAATMQQHELTQVVHGAISSN